MKPRSAWILGVCLALACLGLALSFGQPSAAQQKAVPKGGFANQVKGVARAPSIGRYQIVAAGSQRDVVIVLDTATGHCWRRTVYGGEQWADLGSPPAQEGR